MNGIFPKGTQENLCLVTTVLELQLLGGTFSWLLETSLADVTVLHYISAAAIGPMGYKGDLSHRANADGNVMQLLPITTETGFQSLRTEQFS